MANSVYNPCIVCFVYYSISKSKHRLKPVFLSIKINWTKPNLTTIGIVIILKRETIKLISSTMVFWDQLDCIYIKLLITASFPVTYTLYYYFILWSFFSQITLLKYHLNKRMDMTVAYRKSLNVYHY